MLSFFLPQVPIDRLDALAQSRDVAALSQFLADPRGANPFKILSTGGGYAAGSMGWHAKLMQPKDGTAEYVVFSTPIIAEDAGELLFRVNSNQRLVFIPERDDFGMRLDHHSFDVSFDLSAHRVIVTDQMRGAWTTPPKPHFMFRISPTFRVAEISDSNHRPVPFAQAGGIVAVSPPSRDGRFTISYSGTVEKPGFSRVIGANEATLSGTVWYPMIGRHPATYDIAMHTPKNWLAVAQGDELATSDAGTERVTKYRMNLPVVWLSATAGPYRRTTSLINGHQFSTISAQPATKVTEESMLAQNENNAEVIDFYSKTFGAFPFKSWTTVDSNQFRQGVGALEAYSFATYPEGTLPFLDSHEPAHTWWGGIINNDYLASIWNESFADYSQVVFNRDRSIGNLVERQRAYVPGMVSVPEFDAAPLAHSGQDIGPPATALGYLKGAYVLQALEDEIGTPTFLHALHEWIRTNPSRHIGAWEDFEAVVNRVSEQDYKWFFDEWVRRPGLPNCSLTEGTWRGGQFKGKVSFTGEPYRFDTDAVVEFPDGERTSARVHIDPATDGRFTIDCAQRPNLVALDPWQIIARHGMPSAPPSGIRNFRRDRTYVDPQTPKYMKSMVSGTPLDSLPTDLDGIFLVGSPASLPALVPLCEKAGFHVAGNHLTYKGTTIDLNDGGAVAVVDLPNGHHCLIGLGACPHLPGFGKARLALFNAKGQVLRADTDPTETGSLTIKLSPK